MQTVSFKETILMQTVFKKETILVLGRLFELKSFQSSRFLFRCRLGRSDFGRDGCFRRLAGAGNDFRGGPSDWEFRFVEEAHQDQDDKPDDDCSDGGDGGEEEDGDGDRGGPVRTDALFP